MGLTERRVERGPLGAVSIGRFLGAILSRPFPAGPPPPPPSHPTAPAPHISPGSPSCQSGASLTPSQFLRIVSLLSPRGFLSPGSCLPCLCFSASYLNPIHGPRPLTWELHSPPTSWVIFPYSVYSVSLFPNYKPLPLTLMFLFPGAQLSCLTLAAPSKSVLPYVNSQRRAESKL